MRIGLSSYTYTWAIGVPGFPPPAQPLTAAALLDRTARSGWGLVQFGDNLPLHALGDDLIGLVQQAKRLNVAVEVGTRGIDTARLRRYADIAVLFGAPFVRVVIDDGQDRPSPSEVVQRLSEVEPDYRSAGLVLAIENHDRFTVAELVDIVERCGDWVGICLDTVNSFGALEGPDVVIEALAPHTVNVHLKDFDVLRAEHQMGFEIVGRPLGRGRLDAAAVLQRLIGIGREPTAVIELWTPFADSIATTIDQEAAWADESMDWARSWVRRTGLC